MKIDVDCSGCGSRYQVDESLAGKKSRCKDCGNLFRIPLGPTALSGRESNRQSATAQPADSLTRSLRTQAGSVPPVDVAVTASPAIIPSGAARGTIVLNCPRCFKRYEVDASLTGKKSRCKDCKEVFTIPAPLSAPAPPPPEPSPTANKSSLGLRNFTVIPEEVMTAVRGSGRSRIRASQGRQAAPLRRRFWKMNR